MRDHPKPLEIETKDSNDLEGNESIKSYSILCPKDKKNQRELYNILFEFILEKKNISIKINKIDDGPQKINPIYSVLLSLEDWNKLAPEPNLFLDISIIFKELKKIDSRNCFLKFHEHSLDLGINLKEYYYDPIIITLKEEKNEEGDLEHNKIIKENININKENKILEERLNKLEKEIELLKSILPNYLDRNLF